MSNENEVYVQDNIIIIEVIGDQDLSSVNEMGDRAKTLIGEQRTAGRPAFILDILQGWAKSAQKLAAW